MALPKEPNSMSLNCPRCSRDYLMIKKLTGMERIFVAWTKKRAFLCRTCAFKFRAFDRRRTSREVSHAEVSHALASLARLQG